MFSRIMLIFTAVTSACVCVCVCLSVCPSSSVLVCSSCSSMVSVCKMFSVWTASARFVSSCWWSRVTASCFPLCSLLSSDWLLSTWSCRLSSSSNHKQQRWNFHHVTDFLAWSYDMRWSAGGCVLSPPGWLAGCQVCPECWGGRAGRGRSAAVIRQGFLTPRAPIGCSKSAVWTSGTTVSTQGHRDNLNAVPWWSIYWLSLLSMKNCQLFSDSCF